MEDISDVKLKKTVFVTVGTTCFDALVKTVDSKEVQEVLFARGYNHLVIQMGHATYVPSKAGGQNGTLAVEYVTLLSSIADHLRSASLVISLARSGSIFETLRLSKPLIGVVNEDLMDNHQSELAEELAERKHLYCASPQSLHETIVSMNLETLLPTPQVMPRQLLSLLTDFLVSLMIDETVPQKVDRYMVLNWGEAHISRS